MFKMAVSINTIVGGVALKTKVINTVAIFIFLSTKQYLCSYYSNCVPLIAKCTAVAWDRLVGISFKNNVFWTLLPLPTGISASSSSWEPKPRSNIEKDGWLTPTNARCYLYYLFKQLLQFIFHFMIE